MYTMYSFYFKSLRELINLDTVFIHVFCNSFNSGDVTNLLEYETERQRAVVPMMVATDLLNRLFSTSSALPTAARTAGLLAVNAAIPLKVT